MESRSREPKKLVEMRPSVKTLPLEEKKVGTCQGEARWNPAHNNMPSSSMVPASFLPQPGGVPVLVVEIQVHTDKGCHLPGIDTTHPAFELRDCGKGGRRILDI